MTIIQKTYRVLIIFPRLYNYTKQLLTIQLSMFAVNSVMGCLKYRCSFHQ